MHPAGGLCPAFFHEKDKRQYEDHEYAQEEKGVIERQHRGLFHETAVKGGKRALVCQGRGKALLLKHLRRTVHSQLIGPVEGGEMVHQTGLMELGPSGYDRRDKGDPETAAEVPEKVINGGGVSHVLLLYARHGECSERDEEKTHAHAKDDPRPDDGIKIGKQAEL